MRRIPYYILLTISLSLLYVDVEAQYFGRNKPRYENFEFDVIQSEHFEIYKYFDNDKLLLDMAQYAENWYHLHQKVLLDTFKHKNPLILYNSHADFQQTNTISGNISVGTGGVTEGLKNRVVMPLSYSLQQTNHVLGHELVHAFQYHMLITGDSTSIRNVQNLPLWMVEGLAEYLSIGRIDPFTAMWMRDAVMNDNIPELKKMSNPKYFPYRYGQAFWSFLTGIYGDQVIEPFFMATAKYGLLAATDSVLNTSLDNLSNMWQNALTTHYEQFTADETNTIGRKVVSEENAGRMNISPSISPDARYVIFLSEKDLFSTDLYLAKASNGEIIRKVASTFKDSHIDDYNYLESSGTWSPDSKQFAFVGITEGRNVLIIKDVFSGKTKKEISFEDELESFSNPSWSPDGKTILVTGMVNGQPDLYAININTKKFKQLTDDDYTEWQANWSVDGKKVVFSTDRLSRDLGQVNGRWPFNLAVMDMTDYSIENLKVFYGADNLNPVYDLNNHILFISNRNGYRNIYRYVPDSNKVYQLTDFVTGISGITKYSPALSVAVKRNRLMYSHYFNNGYDIYYARDDRLMKEEVPLNAVNMDAGTLPVVSPESQDIVTSNLNHFLAFDPISLEDLKQVEYKPKFTLDYVSGGGGIGISTNNNFGTNTGVAGGINMLFSDILGDNQLFAGIALNGEIQDFAASFTYVNRKRKIAWGGSVSHIPYRTGRSYAPTLDTVEFDDGFLPVIRAQTDLRRIFEDRAGVFARYPFSTTTRVELGGSYSRYYYRTDRYTNTYNAVTGVFLDQDREKIESPPGFNLFNTNAALVGDNSFFGLTAPLKGWRYRLSAEKYYGEFDFESTLVDGRRYFWTKPVSFAFRGLYYGRYGEDETALPPLYVGDIGFVRGLGFSEIGNIERDYDISVNQLIGSKLFIANFEVRLPFTGPEQLALIKSGALFTDLNLFVDGGVAYTDFDDFDTYGEENYVGPLPVLSTGISLRVNLFGALILEPYYAFPIVPDPNADFKLRMNKSGLFGLNILPGF